VLLGKLIVSQLVENLAVHYHIYENLPLVSAKSIRKFCVYSIPLYYLVKVQTIMLMVMYFSMYSSQHFVLKPPY
jgi:hypothetical protein